eukprot:TRINITY_DN3231_c0_g1_i1.p1 TRINITY_DN3231_c0_g1~~TRINITY_DN3231_c0_g1_i1.p1  ORF type:complete len:452 (+),score=11.25 TRINITY_DN3231_c0_g1_i1:62-1417(+)
MMFKKRPPPVGWVRYPILFLHVLAGVLTAGVIVGFGQLYPILVDAGLYRNRCGDIPANQTSCTEQLGLISNMFNYGATISIFIQSPSGVLLDFVGPKITAMIGLTMFIPGCVMFGLSTAKLDMYLAGFCLISAGGPMVFVSIMPTANLFPKYSSVVLTMMNGSYGGGALVFLLFNFLYFRLHYSFKSLFLAYSIISGVLALLVLLTWPLKKYDEPPNEESHHHRKAKDPSVSRFRSILIDMLNVHFIWLCLVTAYLVMKSNFYLATSDAQLSFMSDDKNNVDLYSKIFGLMLPLVGFAVAPIGLVVDKLGLAAGAFFLLTLNAISSGIGLVQYLPIQIVNFITFSMYYPYIYGYWSTFLVYRFGFDNYGVLFAGVAIVAAVLSLAGTPLSNLATTPDQTFWINVGLLIGSAVFVVYPIGLIIFNRRRSISDESRPLLGDERPINHVSAGAQ